MVTMTETTTLTVRPMRVEEVPLCVPFGHAFYEEMQLTDTFSPESFIEAWTTLLCVTDAVILGLWHDDRLVGGFGAAITQNINSGVRLGNEYFLYVSLDYRHGSGALRLIRAFQAWARTQNARRCRMVISEDDPHAAQFARLYARLGGRRCESTWEFPV